MKKNRGYPFPLLRVLRASVVILSGALMAESDDCDRLAEPSDDDLVDTLRLCLVSGVGPRIRKALLERFGTARAVLAAAPSELRDVQGVGPKLTHKIAGADHEIDVEAEIALCRRHGIDILTESDPAYPRVLREIHDPPGVLFVRGKLKPEDALAIGIVGTRHATQYGLRQAERLAGSLARAGLTIISGLARGIDAAAHRGALAAGGRTIAVLASGVMNIYPPEHDKLADEVAAHGALVSESPPRSEPLAGTFPAAEPAHQRPVAGGDRGRGRRAERGADHRPARDGAGPRGVRRAGQRRQPRSRGCHQLIRDGAKLVESADDVLEELGPLVEAAPRDDGQVIHHPAELLLNELEQQVLAAIGGEATSIDRIVVGDGSAGLAGALDAQRAGNAAFDPARIHWHQR